MRTTNRLTETQLVFQLLHQQPLTSNRVENLQQLSTQQLLRWDRRTPRARAQAAKLALEEQIIPIFESIREQFKQPGLNEVDCGQGIAQATLMAFEQGLGTCCLGTPHGEQIRQNLGLPESARVILLQTVGYPAESPDAGGQRPRQPFEKLFHMNTYGKAFPRSEEVVAELAADGMLQDPAPTPWREQELEYLKNALGVKGHGLL